MLICGRNAAKAQAFCDSFQGVAKTTALALDRNDIAPVLADQRPDMVVDASGPFQDYGDDPYRVVKACIAAKINYLDFADAADFVFGIEQFDQPAKDAGVFVLSGVSSFPVLTAAVLREFSKDMTIKKVTGGIAPSPYAGIGLNVMRAVVGYAGGPVRLLRNGKMIEAKGLTESMRYTVSPPGRLPLANLRFSLVEVPDLRVLPAEHPDMTDIWMGAGPVPESLHRVLNLLAKMRATFRLPALTPFAKLFYRVLNLMKFGDHRGGMFVKATGHKNGQPFAMSWHLLAEGDDGPYIPSMAIESIVRKHLTGNTPALGARVATNALTLADYDQLFEGRTIFTGFRSSDDKDGSIYQQVLGQGFDGLPERLRVLHSPNSVQKWQGLARVQRGKGLLAKGMAALMGFPAEADKTPVTVTLTPSEAGELWQRDFAGKRFSSFQKPGTGRNQHLMLERFGAVTFALALVSKDNRLYLVPRRWTFLGIPMPKFLLPSGETFEEEHGGKFCFNVVIKAPIIGLIVAYQGSLTQV